MIEVNNTTAAATTTILIILIVIIIQSIINNNNALVVDKMKEYQLFVLGSGTLQRLHKNITALFSIFFLVEVEVGR